MDEKRRLPRHQLRVPIAIGSSTGMTTDLNATGVRFESSVALPAGSPIEFELSLPASDDRHIVIRCGGRVTRVEPGTKTYIAATIEHLEFGEVPNTLGHA